MVGLVTKTLKDGGGTDFTAYFYDDGTALAPATALWDFGAGSLVSWSAASPVSQSGTWTVQPGNTANTTAWKVDGSAVTQPVSIATAPALVASTATIGAVVQVPRATANGNTSSRVNSAASTNATSLKASAGNVARIDAFNVAAYDVFLKLYNKASAPTVGTDTPVWTIPIKAGTGYAREFPSGKSFATGIAYAITKLQADSDTTAVAAGDLTGAIDWI